MSTDSKKKERERWRGIKDREVPDVYAVAPHSLTAAEMSLVSSDRAETTKGQVCGKSMNKVSHTCWLNAIRRRFIYIIICNTYNSNSNSFIYNPS